jgi:hypothetical protein
VPGQSPPDAVRAYWRQEKKAQRDAARERGRCTRCIGRRAKKGGAYCGHCLRQIADLQVRS